ncbi:unnamed protein product [Aureobasidium vineae]|uniref:Extracellular membrane protein CFEM domain-containing protein n=1 Tax=Aureobasidium vineae TaxID=2773715 RepID=A0A9N8JVJ1_9PEZI|nr:unnamed protein product [Aureobasidium vineae]
MFSKISIFFTVLALLIQITVATPPACVIQAPVWKIPDDVKDICANGSAVEQTLVSDCGNKFNAATSAFSSICSGVGVTISAWSAASSPTTPASSPAVIIAGASTILPTSDVKTDSTSISVPASASGADSIVKSTDSAVKSTDIAVTTATGILTETSTVTSTQGADSSATSSGSVSTGAAEHVEKGGLVMGVMAAAGLVMAL